MELYNEERIMFALTRWIHGWNGMESKSGKTIFFMLLKSLNAKNQGFKDEFKLKIKVKSGVPW